MPQIRSLLLLALVLTSGCEREEAEKTPSREFVQIQADQNRRLVELQNQVHAQHAEIGRQRDALEKERRELAAQRHRDPVIAESIFSIGTLLACLCPILLAWVLLKRADPGTDPEVIAETLIRDVSAGPSSILIPSLIGPAATQRLAEPSPVKPQNLEVK